MKKIVIILLTSGITFTTFHLFGCSGSDQQNEKNHGTWNSSDGYVPNKETAIKVAEVILTNIYGKRVLKQRPFTCELKGDTIWVIEGTLKEGIDGGTAYIEIQKADCKILKITHGK